MPSVLAEVKKRVIEDDVYRVQTVLKTINYLNVHNKYNFVKKVGHGTYGAVVELLSPDKERHVAAKIVLEELVSKTENEIWADLSHKNILPLIAAAYIPSAHSYVYITPLCPAALNELVQGNGLGKDKEGFEKAPAWLNGVCSGVQYLHNKKLCHLDIKLSNVLINDDGRALLCDFGSLTLTEGGTDRYASPFIYRPPEAQQSDTGRKAILNGFYYDIYTVGMLSLELFTKQALGESLNWEQGRCSWTEDLYPKIFDILQKERFETLVKKAFWKSKIKRKTLCDLRDFMRGCFNLNPERRPVADALLEHVIFGGMKDFRGVKYDAWLKRWELKKLEFVINLHVCRAVRLEFKISPQSNNNYLNDQNQNVDGTDPVQTETKDISLNFDNKEHKSESESESETTVEVKKSPSHRYDVQKDRKDTSTRCESCSSDEREFIDLRKKKTFFNRIGSGIIKAFNRLCCCCCRKKKLCRST